MAKLCSVCDSFCVYFLIFLTIRAVYSVEDYYFYDTDSTYSHLNEFLTLNLEDGNHHIEKRQTTNTQSPLMTNEPLASNISADVNITTTATAKNLNKINNKAQKLLQLGNVTLAKDLQKNLGENGAGIRKNYTIAPSLPILPDKNVATRVILENSSITRINETEEEDLLPPIEEIDETDEEFNMTLTNHNITEVKMESHTYYNSTIITAPESGQHYWVGPNSSFTINDLLSKSHRRAATVKLSFDFPFYGHLIRNVTVATGGFIYTGDYVHSWLAATQYIAPLMANFDTSLSDDSYIKYLDNSTAFTVQWQNVALQDKPSDGQFTFQATLHNNGDIVFVYQNVPSIIKKMQDHLHPVKVGLSDAYIMDHEDYHVRRKTIYEYHRVNFPKEDIKNWTLIYLRALPTCLDNKDCESCLMNDDTNFQCKWCASTNRCSNGMDRHHQDWVNKGCNQRQIVNESDCRQIYTNEHFNDDYTYINHPISNDLPRNSGRLSPNIISISPKQPVQMGVSGILAILFIIVMVVGLGMWIIYAYRNPHTTSGQILIRYRPSQWRWRRGEARYTAATIHM